MAAQFAVNKTDSIFTGFKAQIPVRTETVKSLIFSEILELCSVKSRDILFKIKNSRNVFNKCMIKIKE